MVVVMNSRLSLQMSKPIELKSTPIRSDDMGGLIAAELRLSTILIGKFWSHVRTSRKYV